MLNNKKLFFIMALIVLLLGLTVASATSDIQKEDISTTVSGHVEKTGAEKNIETQTIVKDTTKKDKTITKKAKINTKSEAKTIVLNNETFDEYLNVTRTQGSVVHHYFNDEVNNGDTIDIQGKITDRNAFHITVDKKLNFITSTNDGEFDFGGAGQIIFNNASSGSTVDGITFSNCQFTTANASDITINNITTLNIKQSIGAGIGSFSIRDGSENITITNSFFKSVANTGHSNVVFAAAYNCLFENNTVQSGDEDITGSIGNIFYFTTYNIGQVPIAHNVNITVRNNKILGVNVLPNQAICVGMMIEGYGHTIENNLIVKEENLVGIQWTDPEYQGEGQIDPTETGNITFKNNTLIGKGDAQLGIKGVVSGNIFNVSTIISGPLVYNNTFRTVTITGNTIFENNTIDLMDSEVVNYTKLSVTGQNNIISNVTGTINNFTIKDSNNTISNITVDSKVTCSILGSDNIIQNSNIKSTEVYTININGTNNTIIKNSLKSNNLEGNLAVKSITGANTIENNTPKTDAQKILITEDNYNNYFDDKGNIKTQIPDNSLIILKGNFTDKDFVLDNLVAVISAENFTLYNSTVTVGKNISLIFDESFVINNTKSDKKNALIINADNTKINVRIYADSTASDVVAVIVKGNYNIVKVSVSFMQGAADEENATGIGVLVESSYNIINNNADISGNDLLTHTATVLTETSSYNNITVTGTIVISGNNNVLTDRVVTYHDNVTAVILNNANNTLINGMYYQSKNTPAIILNNSNNNSIENALNINTFETEYAILIVNNSNNNIIRNNHIENNQEFGGNNAVFIDETSFNNTLTRNTNTLVKLNDENYEEYFVDSQLKEEYSGVELIGDLNNKDLIFSVGAVLLGNNHTINNGTVIKESASNDAIIRNTVINNTNKPAFVLNGRTSFLNNTIYFVGDDATVVDLHSGSFINAANGFKNNKIIAYGNNLTLLNVGMGTMNLEFFNNTFEATGDNLVAVNFKELTMKTNFKYNNIAVNAGKTSKGIVVDTPGITMYFSVQYNNFLLNADESSTMFEVVGMSQMYYIDYNNFTTNSNASSIILNFVNPTNAIMESITHNNFIINSDNATTAIRFVPMGNSETINYNNFLVNSNQSTNLITFNGMLISTKIQYNKILVNTTQGSVPIINASMGPNSQITNNYIESLDLLGDKAIKVSGARLRLNTPTDTTGRNVTLTVEDVELKAGITSNIMINVTNMFKEAIEGTITATIDDEEIPVTDNMLVYTPDKAGKIVIKYTFTDSEGKYATTSVSKTYMIEVLPPQLSTENLTLTDSTNITAYFYDENGVAANDGKAILRVNGKTLRDEKGEVIYVNVENGKAVIEDVNITSEWMKPDTTIQAVYCGNDNIDPIFTELTTVNVTKPEATIKITSQLEATAGKNVTLTAKVTDGENNINSGRVAFKLNGKTLKGEDGKALYADVIDGIATTTYTIPAKTKANKYTLTAVFTDTTYERVEATEDFVINKA